MMFVGTILIPVGFFLGGVVTTEIDPWVGVFLVPIGGLFFAVGLLLSLLSLRNDAFIDLCKLAWPFCEFIGVIC